MLHGETSESAGTSKPNQEIKILVDGMEGYITDLPRSDSNQTVHVPLVTATQPINTDKDLIIDLVCIVSASLLGLAIGTPLWISFGAAVVANALAVLIVRTFIDKRRG